MAISEVSKLYTLVETVGKMLVPAGHVQKDRPCSAVELFMSVHLPKQDGCSAGRVV